jgi:AcrR family transcriptional regulator
MNKTEVNEQARESLQERKRRATRDAILEAMASVAREQGVSGFSVQDVANRAGVSHRTVYRAFDSRDALLEAAHEWVEEWIAEQGLRDPQTLADLAEAAERSFEVFERQADLIAAGTILLMGQPKQPSARERRSARMLALFEQELPALSEDERLQGYAAVRHLFSSITWTVMTRENGLTTPQAGASVRWAIQTLVDDLKRRNQEASNAKQGA